MIEYYILSENISETLTYFWEYLLYYILFNGNIPQGVKKELTFGQRGGTRADHV